MYYKKTLIGLTIVLGLIITGVARADTNVKTTPTEFVENLASVPGKVGNQINIEIEKTKAYQAKSWAEAKAQWQRLLSKFQAN